MKNNDKILVDLFGKEVELSILCTGNNQFDEEGDYKEDENFELLPEEVEYIQWFVKNVKIEDYRKEITEYCNEQYMGIGEDTITEDDLEKEVFIDTIAINICEVSESNDGWLYPEISFCGECNCDPEHGICIGFRDKKFLGIESWDWTL